MENRRYQNRARPYDINARNHVRRNFKNNLNLDLDGPVSGQSGKIQRNKRNQIAFEATRPIGFRTLENVLKIDGDAELILKLSSGRNGFLLLLDEPNIRTELMCLILSVLAKASECSTDHDTCELLRLFYVKIIPKLNCKSNFNRELKFFVGNLNNDSGENTLIDEEIVKAVNNLLILLRRLHCAVNEQSFDAVQDLMQFITSQIEFVNRNGMPMNESITELLAQINLSLENGMPAVDEADACDTFFDGDFREINIFPNTEDIFGDHERFIPENIVEGNYMNGIDHYLDVQFRLLREDFLRPLRNGIYEYIHRKQQLDFWASADTMRVENLNIYQNVQVFGSKKMHNEQIHSCQFDSIPFQDIRWEVSVLSSSSCEFILFYFYSSFYSSAKD